MALSERFEMRLDEDTLQEIDGWRGRQPDLPTRSEAIRRLIERGLSERGDVAPLSFSKAEMLMLSLLCDISKATKAKREIDPDFVMSAITGGNFWALEWQYGGLFPEEPNKREVVKEVVDILDMWDILETGYKKLTAKQKERVRKEASPFGDEVSFPGFDGNNETAYCGVARFLIKDMGRFGHFKGRESLNSHHPSLDTYRRMLKVFLPIRGNLMGRGMNDTEIIDVLAERTHPSRRNNK